MTRPTFRVTDYSALRSGPCRHVDVWNWEPAAAWAAAMCLIPLDGSRTHRRYRVWVRDYHAPPEARLTPAEAAGRAFVLFGWSLIPAHSLVGLPRRCRR